MIVVASANHDQMAFKFLASLNSPVSHSDNDVPLSDLEGASKSSNTTSIPKYLIYEYFTCI